MTLEDESKRNAALSALSTFCATTHEEILRRYLYSPFSDGLCSFATNGHGMLRVHASDLGLGACPEPIKKAIRAFSSNIDETISAGYSIQCKVSDLLDASACDYCDKGVTLPRLCADCQGTGIENRQDIHGKEIELECSGCDGEKQYPGGTWCIDCYGTGFVWKKIKLPNCQFMSNSYLGRIYNVDSAATLFLDPSPKGFDTPIYFQTVIGDGLFMGIETNG